jgi:4'-phosphopantetheinyl transferase
MAEDVEYDHSERTTDGSGARLIDANRRQDRFGASADGWDHEHLGATDVHVVRVPLDGPVDLRVSARLLDDDERRRADGFVYECDRRRFIVAHAAMRVMLGRCVGRPPAALRFIRGAYGKPELIDVPSMVRFNLSHAGEVALLAIGLGHDVGVDVEQERPIDELLLSRYCFSANEQAALASLPAAERRSAFFRCWTRKESFVKAIGLGVSLPLQAFDVGITSKGAPLLQSCAAAPVEPTRWRIVSLSVDDGYAAALTTSREHRRVVLWMLPERFPDDPRAVKVQGAAFAE